MVAVEILHMNAGDEETSYANNSLLQKVVIMKARLFLEETIKNMLSTSTFPSCCIKIADLGCSSGPNTFLVISEIIDTIHGITCQQEVSRKSPDQFQVFLNDLPGNDFNTLFKSLPAFYDQKRLKAAADQNVNPYESCFMSGVPGSFYHRLFPSGTIHFIHSSYSLHWLSKVPENLCNNKRNIYMAKSSPPCVYEAYLEQFQRDFSLFLSLRDEELVSGGCMLLILVGRSIADPSSKDCCCIWELLTKSLLQLVDEGLVEEADVDSFNMPYYNPYEEEVREIVQKQGSFNLDKLEIFEVNWDLSDVVSDKTYDEFNKHRSGQNVANCIRAIAEPMLAAHFGNHIINPLFAKYVEHVAQHLAVEKTKFVNLVISMTKK